LKRSYRKIKKNIFLRDSAIDHHLLIGSILILASIAIAKLSVKIGVISLVFILFPGGLEIQWSEVKAVLWGRRQVWPHWAFSSQRFPLDFIRPSSCI
jgi:hypothetical protein